MRFKTKQRQNADRAPEQDVPAEVNDQSAAVSEEAACCVADIDDVLADMDDAIESEEDKALREVDELRKRLNAGEVGWDGYMREKGVLRAKYAHLNLGCWC